MSDREAARMIDVGDKDATERVAVAEATITMTAEARGQVLAGTRKGNVVEAARIAALQAVKRTPDLLPFCHPIRVTAAQAAVEPGNGATLVVRVEVRAFDRTGVEMEALTGAAVGALCLYDAAKAHDRGAVVSDVRLVSKSGGRSGEWSRGSG